MTIEYTPRVIIRILRDPDHGYEIIIFRKARNIAALLIVLIVKHDSTRELSSFLADA